MAGLSHNLPAAADPNSVVRDSQIERLVSPKAAMLLSAFCITAAHDRLWVEFRAAV